MVSVSCFSLFVRSASGLVVLAVTLFQTEVAPSGKGDRTWKRRGIETDAPAASEASVYVRVVRAPFTVSVTANPEVSLANLSRVLGYVSTITTLAAAIVPMFFTVMA